MEKLSGLCMGCRLSDDDNFVKKNEDVLKTNKKHPTVFIVVFILFFEVLETHSSISLHYSNLY